MADSDDLPETRPAHIHWDVTGRCNLRCAHCRATSRDNPDVSELTTEEAKALIDQIHEIAPDWMSFDGGEPLLRPDLFTLAKYAAGKGLFVFLLTNGTLVTGTLARRVKESGIRSVQVSVDGLEPAHDRIRGRGAYAKTLRGIRNLMDQGLRTSLRITVSRLNLDDVLPLLELSIEMGLAAFGARRVVCVGNAADFSQEVPLRPYRDVIRQVMERGAGRIAVHVGMDPVLIPVTSLKEQLLEAEGTLDVLAGCGAGVSLLHIGSNGDIMPCGVLRIPLGNVRTDAILDVWERHPLMRSLRDRDQLLGACGACDFRYVCGGCRAHAWAKTGEVLAEDPQCLLNV